MSNWIQLLKNNWKEAIAERNFVFRLLFNFALYFLAYLLLAWFLFYNRFRTGTVLHDPIMSFFTTVDFSVPIFFFTYTGIITFIYYIIPHPRLIVPLARGFLVLFTLRVVFIYLIPLQPPLGMIPLNDPFIDHVLGFKQEVLNDLFFSGHVADLCFFVFCCRHRALRKFLVVAAILTTVMLVWQKVHYTADVIAAPLFAYLCYLVFVRKYVTD